jgi:hypothetical protein
MPSGRLLRLATSSRRGGAPYADGHLYEAGPHDHSFALRYELREWVSPNVFRLSHIPPPKLPIVSMLVRNESAATIKWLRIDTDELFLFFVRFIQGLSSPAQMFSQIEDAIDAAYKRGDLRGLRVVLKDVREWVPVTKR